MAGEIKISLNMVVTNGNYKRAVQPNQLSVDMSTNTTHDGIQSVPTTVENLEVGDVGANQGYLYLRNLDAANFVTFGSSSGLEFKLKATEFALVRVTAGTTLSIKADTAAVKVERFLIID